MKRHIRVGEQNTAACGITATNKAVKPSGFQRSILSKLDVAQTMWINKSGDSYVVASWDGEHWPRFPRRTLDALIRAGWVKRYSGDAMTLSSRYMITVNGSIAIGEKAGL